MATIQCSMWANGTIGDELSFFAVAGTIHGNPPQKSGYVVEHGNVTPISERVLYPWMDIDGVTYVRVSG